MKLEPKTLPSKVFKGFAFANGPEPDCYKLNINRHVCFPLLQNPSFCGDFCCFSSGCFISSAHCCKTVLSKEPKQVKEIGLQSEIMKRILPIKYLYAPYRLVACFCGGNDTCT
ncbi:hypothetical protein HanXRQr2_Chr01g0033301 [Helianthus annuus]|uniref:Uncharacterized protein n=1 Tax=Helianthus annuus TaxID=4232 RepID=A0A9K3P5B1_HELAN|nr:hypothetical protein HanXRQr2_Chr01g0033301 [Helianthus annuus]KAJ0957846.1 hypothetical protein HanPSC8_Chr01g0032461 [Helianthus annuus]